MSELTLVYEDGDNTDSMLVVRESNGNPFAWIPFIWTDDDAAVALPTDFEVAEANARNLVRCWNAHEAMVAAIEAVVAVLDEDVELGNDFMTQIFELRGQLVAALAAAKGTTP